ncbi:MAG: hypothetical protein WBM77_05680 [Maribacter sp.]
MTEENNNENISTTSMFSYLNRVQNYVKRYAENCRHSFNSMLNI